MNKLSWFVHREPRSLLCMVAAVFLEDAEPGLRVRIAFPLQRQP